jgi:hypothetical protein
MEYCEEYGKGKARLPAHNGVMLNLLYKTGLDCGYFPYSARGSIRMVLGKYDACREGNILSLLVECTVLPEALLLRYHHLADLTRKDLVAKISDRRALNLINPFANDSGVAV